MQIWNFLRKVMRREKFEMADKGKEDSDTIEAGESYAREANHNTTPSDVRARVHARANASDLLKQEELEEGQASKGRTRRKGGPSLDEESELDSSSLQMPPTESDELEE